MIEALHLVFIIGLRNGVKKIQAKSFWDVQNVFLLMFLFSKISLT